ncbi:hypothetical protein BJX63DRAFT_429864 [Aspergillus granulosus]|uniref:Uncharacterized protein n=1 Tax=Aspergillus granulosus TaxID=176169 RepID=A0ABR4HNT9_9EURO
MTPSTTPIDPTRTATCPKCKRSFPIAHFMSIKGKKVLKMCLRCRVSSRQSHKKRRSREAAKKVKGLAKQCCINKVDGNDEDEEDEDKDEDGVDIDANSDTDETLAASTLLEPPTTSLSPFFKSALSSPPISSREDLFGPVYPIEPMVLSESDSWVTGPGTQLQSMLSSSAAESTMDSNGLPRVSGYTAAGLGHLGLDGSPMARVLILFPKRARLDIEVPTADPFCAVTAYQGANFDVTHAELLSKFTKTLDSHDDPPQVETPSYPPISDGYDTFLVNILTEKSIKKVCIINNFQPFMDQYPEPDFSELWL